MIFVFDMLCKGHSVLLNKMFGVRLMHIVKLNTSETCSRLLQSSRNPSLHHGHHANAISHNSIHHSTLLYYMKHLEHC